MIFKCKLLGAILTAAITLYPVEVKAQTLSPEPMNIDGRQGVWFPRDDADYILDVMTRRIPLAGQIIEGQSRIITKQQDMIRSSTTALAQTEVLLNIQIEQNEKLARKVIELNEQGTPLIEHPALWAGIGSGVTLIILWLATNVVKAAPAGN
jgi:hypothetical protein